MECNVASNEKAEFEMKYLSCFLLGLLTYSTSLLADYPYYHFTSKKIEINDQHFYRYIKPQAKTIIQEYYSLLRKLKTYQIDLLKLYTDILNLNLTWDELRSSCLSDETCQKKINQIVGLLIKIEKFCASELEYGLKPGDKENTPLLNYNLPKDDEIKKELFDITNQLQQLENLLYTKKIDFKLNENFTLFHRSFKNKIHALLLQSEKIMFYGLKRELRIPHEQLWYNYIKPLEEKIIQGSDKQFLIASLGQLNMAWNGYHMNMIKSNIKLDLKYQNLIVLMHNRWNSILKLVL